MRNEERNEELTDAELEAVIGGMGCCGKGKKEVKEEAAAPCC
jgi:bacteriocin-like protein